MTVFAGFVRCDGAPVRNDIVARLQRSLGGRHEVSVWRDHDAALAIGPATRLPDPAVRRQPIELADESLLVADLRLDDRPGLVSALPRESMPDTQDAALAARAIERWGGNAFNRLIGDFALALWHPRAKRLTLALDVAGTRPLYYAMLPDGGIAFAGTLRTLLALPDLPRDIDEQDLACLLTRASSENERTLYRAIRRVPPGSVATFDAAGVRITRYWGVDSIAPVRFAADDDYTEAGRALLDQAVAARLASAGGTAVMLSGGFDSTGVAATAARLLGDRRLGAFTRVPGVSGVSTGLDERALAGATAAAYANMDWSVIDTDWIARRDAEPDSEAALLGVPRSTAFAPTWFEPLLMAVDRSGAQVLLDGAMGNCTLSWSAANADAADRPAAPGRRGIRGWLAAMLRRDTARDAAADLTVAAWSRIAPVSRDFLDTLDFDAHIAAASPDRPECRGSGGLENRLRFIQQQRPRDILSALRRTWPFERLDPFTDRRMIEFTLGIPAEQYRRDGIDRWLARRVLADRVPPQVLAATVTGVQQPEWLHMANRNRAAMAEQVDRIARSPLAARVLDIPRMRALIDAWPEDGSAGDRDARRRMLVIRRGINVGSFLRWHEGGNA